jgi:3-phosphoshikimate 1-carboxyvinyltransferase
MEDRQVGTESIAIEPRGPIHGSIRPPGSKSITNRALVCAALAEGTSVLRGALDSEDTRVMIFSLGRLGIDVTAARDHTELAVRGCGGRIPVPAADLDLANSGTSIRFLTALVTLGRGEYRLDGVPRMRQRPIEDLLDSLRALGADVRSEYGNGCPPVVVRADGLPGGTAKIRGSVSSQYLSALLMAAPYAENNVCLEVEGDLVSQPYVRMTLAVMSAFGIAVNEGGLDRFEIAAGQRYRGRSFEIEPDASAASYFWAAAAVTGGRVTVEGLAQNALQGDVRFCQCLARMGCQVDYGDDHITVTGGSLRGITVDMNDISDTVQTLAAVALFADGPTTVSGVGHIRYKETDRIGDLARELRKLGASVEEQTDGLTIVPGPLHGAEIETYNDHRMAMSLALVGLRTPGVVILNPGCTEKTYPRFFEDLQSLG